MSSGRNAKGNGTDLEDFVELRILGRGYLKMGDSDWLFNHRKDKDLKHKYFAREVYVGESAVKGKLRRVEFFLVDQDAFPDGHILECKWQEVPGSTEDKLLRLPLDIKKTGIPTTVIIDGPGFSQGIIDHLKSKVDGYAFRATLSMMEFQVAVNRGFLGSGIIKILPTPKSRLKPKQSELWGDEERA